MNPPPLYRIRRRRGRWCVQRLTDRRQTGTWLGVIPLWEVTYTEQADHPTHAEALADVVDRIEGSRA